ncbi:unnamed protein product [Urochloa decumbens]|uniref:Uncharacterized protein n=1 Tax=Urochloa decumbens TaxID=240449 RepID=A0ABC9F7K4_9POAL
MEPSSWKLAPAVSALYLDHLFGDSAVPSFATSAILAAVPFPSHSTPRFHRARLLRRLASDPLSASALSSILLLASTPSAPTAAAQAHLAVAAYLAATGDDFDAVVGVVFDPRVAAEGALAACSEAADVVGQFRAAVGTPSAQATLKSRWGNQSAAERRVRELIEAEWAAIGPSLLEQATQRIGGDAAPETWRAADEATRSMYQQLVGEERAQEIHALLNSHAGPTSTSTPEHIKFINKLKRSTQELHDAVDDPLPAAKEDAERAKAILLAKGVKPSGAPWSSSPTSEASHPRPSLFTPRNVVRSPLQTNLYASPSQTEKQPLHGKDDQFKDGQHADQKKARRKARKWSEGEEIALKSGVQRCGVGKWKQVLLGNPQAFHDRTAVDLKDKWRNLSKRAPA